MAKRPTPTSSPADAPRKAGTASKVEAPVARNPRARHEYHILEVQEAGLALTGSEVKSLRAREASIVESFARFQGSELYLIGMSIPPYRHAAPLAPHVEKRPRKLLLHAAELRRLAGKLGEQGTTLVPLSVYFKRGWAKVELALVAAKKAYDKRAVLREREQRRELDRARRQRR